MLILTHHAYERASQWNLSEEQIAFVVEHGERCYKTGVLFYQMLEKNIPQQLLSDNYYAKLNGATVVVSSQNQDRTVVITVYRNEKAFKEDRKKVEYRRRWQQLTDDYGLAA